VVGPTNGVLHVSHVSQGGERAYARYAGLAEPPQLIEIPLKNGETQVVWADGKPGRKPAQTERVTTQGPSQYPEPKSILIESYDGTPIPAYHWQAPQRRGPPKGVLIVAHGGLHTQTFPTWEAYIGAMLEQGCDVVAVNFRGSSGYGHRFEQMGTEADRVLDLLAARDYAINTLHAGARKVYLSGISHGASLAAMAAAQGEEIGGLILISWAGPIRQIQTEFVNSFPILAFHGDLDDSVSAKRAKLALDRFVAPAGELVPQPQWRLFEGEGHFFYRTASWAEVYTRTAKLVKSEL
jgi:dienelactone hydrolase